MAKRFPGNWGGVFAADLSSDGLLIAGDDSDPIFRAPEFPNRSRGKGVAIRLNHPYPVRNQMNVDCCVSCALATCMEILDAAEGPAVPLSVLYHYFQARRIAGMSPDDLGGLPLRTGFEAINRYGICKRDLHITPVSAENAKIEPSSIANSDASSQRIARDSQGRTAYRPIPAAGRARAVKRALMARRPLVYGFWVTQGYLNLRDDGEGVFVPEGEERDRSHVVSIIGFHNEKRIPNSQRRGAFFIKDSRGKRFARDGHWWLPYVLINSSMTRLCFAIGAINY